MRLRPIAFLALLTACGGRQDNTAAPDPCLVVAVNDRIADSAPYVEVGKLAKVVAVRSVNPTCKVQPRAIDAKVFDPRNQPVDISTDFEVIAATGERQLTATFTPK